MDPRERQAVQLSDTIEASSDASDPISIRVSPHGYITALFLGTFFSALAFYLNQDVVGISLFAISWILLPFFALNDRVSFDGRRLERTGLVPRVWSWLNSSRRRIKISDVEQVETAAVRAIKRGGVVYYRYRTVVRGKGISISFASGGDEYRQMIHAILPKLDDAVLDTRSIELRDHLGESKETLMKAEFSRIPSADVLESFFRKPLPSRQRLRHVSKGDEDEKAEDLRELANELRVQGHLARALEAFRRAIVLKPRDGWLLFEFARCLHAFAGVSRQPELERRALAVLRLSEKRANDDPDLLTRLGEWYFSLGEYKRAGNLFENVRDRLGENFRAARGLAEIALREGKIAHVIHHFGSATHSAQTPALRRWSKAEADYFARLNSDEEYMELEIGRVNSLETVERSKSTALKIAFFAFPFVAVGVIFEDALVADIGWAVSTVSLLIWTGLILSSRMLSRRIPYELLESED
ncbi:MAG TPA: tetratricopeptide repeat protein [Pyrinomonadaceae bacterium]|nr:tetratricopeptide repeat protein [Pyrinomonadaceae bacterium]